MKDQPKYKFEDLTEEEASVIVSSLFRELHLIEGNKHYKSSIIRGILDKARVKDDGFRPNRKLD
jgi:hypothetical protein